LHTPPASHPLRAFLHLPPSAVQGRLDKSAIDTALSQVGLRGDLRAEQLDVPTMIALADAVRAASR